MLGENKDAWRSPVLVRGGGGCYTGEILNERRWVGGKRTGRAAAGMCLGGELGERELCAVGPWQRAL